MTNQDTDTQEQSNAQAIIRMKAGQLAKPVLLSLTDADTGELRATPHVAAIMADETFKRMYDASANQLREIGTPSVPVTPKRILAHVVEHNSNTLLNQLSHADHLAELFVSHAREENIAVPKAVERLTTFSSKTSTPPLLPEHDRLAEINDTPFKARLSEAKKIVERVLFDREGNLKPNGILTRQNIAPAFNAYTVQTQGEVGTLALISEETLARNFAESVLGDDNHAMNHTLREAILKAAKSLPVEKPTRVQGSISDNARAQLDAASDASPRR